MCNRCSLDDAFQQSVHINLSAHVSYKICGTQLVWSILTDALSCLLFRRWLSCRYGLMQQSGGLLSWAISWQKRQRERLRCREIFWSGTEWHK